MVKKLKKQTIKVVETGIGLGVGATVISSIGGSTAGNVGQGLQSVSSFAPAIGTTLGGVGVIRSLELLKPNKKIKIRVRRKQNAKS